MKFTSHSTTNMILGSGGIEGVVPLPATMIIDPDGQASITSFWMPDAEELKVLNAGGGVMLTVMGTGHPPVIVGVAPEKGFKTDD